MKSLIAFIKKEYTEQLRTGRLMITLTIFVLFGIMNPAIAKISPWLLEIMSDSLSESGINVTVITVSALESWVQFFKNMPIALIAFVLLYGSIFTKEYTSGTLVLSLTKGLERYKVVISKACVLTDVWTVGYWICFFITYFYNSYFWDNKVAHSLALSAICWWLFGLFIISLITLFSTLSSSNTEVLMGTGGVVFAFYLIALIPKIKKYLPIMLTDGTSLIYGASEPGSYVPAIVITAVATVIAFIASIPLFNKKQL